MGVRVVFAFSGLTRADERRVRAGGVLHVSFCGVLFAEGSTCIAGGGFIVCIHSRKTNQLTESLFSDFK